MDNTFTCARCGGTFEKGWSDEEAQAEADSLWTPEELSEGTDLICDPCFKGMLAAIPIEEWRANRSEVA